MVIDQEMWIFLATKREGNQKKKKKLEKGKMRRISGGMSQKGTYKEK